MNDMTFRTKLLTNPQLLDEEMLQFLAKNPEKKQTIQQAREFDEKISDVFDIEIPEGLHAKILLNQSYQQNRKNTLTNVETPEIRLAVNSDKLESIETISNQSTKRSTSAWLTNYFTGWAGGIAASLIAFVVMFSLLQTTHVHKAISGEAMVEHILAHIAEDPSLMTAVKLPNSEEEMQQLFASVGAQLNKPVEGMSYAGICEVEGQKGLHIVIQESGEPITIIVMPGQQVAAMQAFEKSGYHGELMPVKGGVVAIVANSMEQVALAQIRFFKSVKFS
ncbi:DUF3379 family protein [Thiomicrorhabdus sp. Kp2]|uniref:DUF3379 family protein n=1 Tax=Thiomicrorhabdus sp. Kp2 TaxID=1123518 RepID=UPI0004081093|nr:DUF3379 family protein [Thiomicrorhabdus sp. Kp2]